MTKAITINGSIRIGVPKFWVMSDGSHDFAFDKRSDEVHFAEGWKEVITPVPNVDYNPETQRLGVIFERENDFTYPIIDKTEEELRNEIKGQAESQRQERIRIEQEKAVLSQFNQIEDAEEILQNQEIFPMWEPDKQVLIGEHYQWFEDLELKLYKVLQSHTTQADWEPQVVPALFVKILPAGAPLVWEVGIAVTVGEEYLYTPDGNTYIVIQSHTTQAGWTPPAVPSLWQLKVV